MISENGEDARLRLVGPRGVAVVTAMLVAVAVGGLELQRGMGDALLAELRLEGSLDLLHVLHTQSGRP